MPTTGLTFLSALAVSVATMPVVLWGVRRLDLVDHPNGRSSHAHPTLRGGGLAAAVGILVATGVAPGLPASTRGALVVATFVFGIIGMADDVVSLDAKKALALQVVAALPVLPLLLAAGAGDSPAVWVFPFTLLWIVAFTNVFNFMDGIDGISAVQAILAGGAWWLVGSTEDVTALASGGAVLAGAAVAFIPFNFPRARVFLGSVGSYAIGAFMAVVVVVALRRHVGVEAIVAPMALYLADTSTTLARRVWAGQRWWEAHCDHAYQRLVRLGWSHAQTTLFAGSIIAVCSVLGLITLVGGAWRAVADAAIALLAGAYLAMPTIVRRRTSRPASPGSAVSARKR